MDLSRMSLGDFEAVVLGSIFPNCKSLRAVSLQNNRFSQRGAKELVEAVVQSPALEDISDLPLRALRTNRQTELCMPAKGLGDLRFSFWPRSCAPTRRLPTWTSAATPS